MHVVWAIALSLLNLVWLATNIFSLPGNWLMVASAAVLAALTWGSGMFSPWTLAACVLLAVVGEVVDLGAAMVGAKSGGAGRGGAWGALLGSVIGAIAGTILIPIPILGSLIGLCGGACAGAFLFEASGGRTSRQSLRAGLGAGVGGFLGKVAKIGVGVVIWIILTIAAFWP